MNSIGKVSDGNHSSDLMDRIDNLAKNFKHVHEKYLAIQSKVITAEGNLKVNNAVHHQLGNMIEGVYTEEALVAAEHFMIAYEDVVDSLTRILENTAGSPDHAIDAAHTTVGVIYHRASQMYDKNGNMIGSDVGRRSLIEYIFKVGGFKIDDPEIIGYMDELAPKPLSIEKEIFPVTAGDESRKRIFNLLSVATPITDGKHLAGQHIELSNTPEIRALHILGDYAGHLYYYLNKEHERSQKAVQLFSSAYEKYITDIGTLAKKDKTLALAKIQELSELLSDHALPLTSPEELVKYVFTEAGYSLSSEEVSTAIPLILNIKK